MNFTKLWRALWPLWHLSGVFTAHQACLPFCPNNWATIDHFVGTIAHTWSLHLPKLMIFKSHFNRSKEQRVCPKRLGAFLQSFLLWCNLHPKQGEVFPVPEVYNLSICLLYHSSFTISHFVRSRHFITFDLIVKVYEVRQALCKSASPASFAAKHLFYKFLSSSILNKSFLHNSICIGSCFSLSFKIKLYQNLFLQHKRLSPIKNIKHKSSATKPFSEMGNKSSSCNWIGAFEVYVLATFKDLMSGNFKIFKIWQSGNL